MYLMKSKKLITQMYTAAKGQQITKVRVEV